MDMSKCLFFFHFSSSLSQTSFVCLLYATPSFSLHMWAPQMFDLGLFFSHTSMLSLCGPHVTLLFFFWWIKVWRTIEFRINFGEIYFMHIFEIGKLWNVEQTLNKVASLWANRTWDILDVNKLAGEGLFLWEYLCFDLLDLSVA